MPSLMACVSPAYRLRPHTFGDLSLRMHWFLQCRFDAIKSIYHKDTKTESD